MICLGTSVVKIVSLDVRYRYPSTLGPLLPTMTDFLLTPGQEVLYKRYHTVEPVEATISGVPIGVAEANNQHLGSM